MAHWNPYKTTCRKQARMHLADGDYRQAHIWMYRAINDMANRGLCEMERRAAGSYYDVMRRFWIV